jgi:4-hydroxybenzoate polyprenyltransferase
MIKKLIEKLENLNLSFWQIASLFASAIFLRTFIENYTNLNNSGQVNGFIDTFIHYPAWFIAVFLSVILVFFFFTRERINKVSSAVSVFSFIIIVPTIIDLVFSQGQKVLYSFIAGSYKELWYDFSRFLVNANEIGIGIKIEIYLVLIFAGFYVFYKTKSYIKSVSASFIVYSVIFLMLTAPIHIFSVFNFFQDQHQVITATVVGDFFHSQELINSQTINRTFLFDINKSQSMDYQKLINIFAITLSIIFLILDIIFLGLIYFIHSREKFTAILRNLRIERIIHFWLLIGGGILVGYDFNPFRKIFVSLFDWLSLASLLFAFLFAWLFAVWENDEADLIIDRVSNSARPLTKGLFCPDEWRSIKWLWFLFAMCFGILSGYSIWIFVLVFILVYHIYSVPPLRLKRLPVLPSILIAINCLLAVLAGFAITGVSDRLDSFPLKYLIGILLVFMLAENIKDIKDIEGDKLGGIKTIPVLLGERLGKIAVGAMIFLAAVLAPIFFYLTAKTFIIGIVFGVIFFLLVNRKKFIERDLFLAYFAYFLCLGIIRLGAF